MPNIQICGMSPEASFCMATGKLDLRPSREARKLKEEIRKRLVGQPFVGDAVVDFAWGQCEKLMEDNGPPQPYIRVCCTDAAQLATIKKLLEGMFDAEGLLINWFVPKS